jgi:hypothetical protein
LFFLIKKKLKTNFHLYIYKTHYTLIPRIGFEFKFHVFFVSIFMKWKWKPSSWNRSSYMKSLGWNTFHPKIINIFISFIKCSSSTNWFFAMMSSEFHGWNLMKYISFLTFQWMIGWSFVDEYGGKKLWMKIWTFVE